MDPAELGRKYDKIAQWWYEYHAESSYGIEQLTRAIQLGSSGGKALDVGCGAGGRIPLLLQSYGYDVTGVDVSEQMVDLARQNHPDQQFIHQDICTWETEKKYDFIVAWDSIFHLPYSKQKTVLWKLCRLLNPEGVLIYTFGDTAGEYTDEWLDDTFYYSSLGIDENLCILLEQGMSTLHLELDQHPEKHVYLISKKPCA